MSNLEIADNVLEKGRQGLVDNMREALKGTVNKALDEFIEAYTDEMWLMGQEALKLRAENEELKAKLKQAEVVPCKEAPCRVRDTVYVLYKEKTLGWLIQEWRVEEIRMTDYQWAVRLWRAGTEDYSVVSSKDFGVWWFTTREEAEKRLEEVKGGIWGERRE